MAETELYYIAGSGVKEIRKGGEIIGWDWGSPGGWTKLKSPVKASYKKIKYNKKNKTWAASKGKASGWKDAKDNTVAGTKMPSSATRTVNGVERTVAVQYQVKEHVIYGKKKSSGKGKKKKYYQYKTTYTTAKPYYYRLRYKEKPVVDGNYSTYRDTDGKYYAYFSDTYYDGSIAKKSPSRMRHPTKFNVTYSEVRKNLNSSANNSDSRDNSGNYVFTNVRSNIVSLELEWTGLKPQEGQELMGVLNRTQSSTDNKNTITNNYIIAQYLDPQTGKPKNGTFYASDRKVEKYPNGMYKTVSVTLTEV